MFSLQYAHCKPAAPTSGAVFSHFWMCLGVLLSPGGWGGGAGGQGWDQQDQQGTQAGTRTARHHRAVPAPARPAPAGEQRLHLLGASLWGKTPETGYTGAAGGLGAVFERSRVKEAFVRNKTVARGEQRDPRRLCSRGGFAAAAGAADFTRLGLPLPKAFLGETHGDLGPTLPTSTPSMLQDAACSPSQGSPAILCADGVLTLIATEGSGIKNCPCKLPAGLPQLSQSTNPSFLPSLALPFLKQHGPSAHHRWSHIEAKPGRKAAGSAKRLSCNLQGKNHSRKPRRGCCRRPLASQPLASGLPGPAGPKGSSSPGWR